MVFFYFLFYFFNFFNVQIKNLPKGATVIDYAYIIHTEIGNKMVAAKVLSRLCIFSVQWPDCCST